MQEEFTHYLYLEARLKLKERQFLVINLEFLAEEFMDLFESRKELEIHESGIDRSKANLFDLVSRFFYVRPGTDIHYEEQQVPEGLEENKA